MATKIRYRPSNKLILVPCCLHLSVKSSQPHYFLAQTTCPIDHLKAANISIYRQMKYTNEDGVSVFGYEEVRGQRVDEGEILTLTCANSGKPDYASMLLQLYRCVGGAIEPSPDFSCHIETVPYPKYTQVAGSDFVSGYGAESANSDWDVPFNHSTALQNFHYFVLTKSEFISFTPRGHWLVGEEGFSLFMHIVIAKIGVKEVLPIVTWSEGNM